jgi:hypothetical protein
MIFLEVGLITLTVAFFIMMDRYAAACEHV